MDITTLQRTQLVGIALVVLTALLQGYFYIGYTIGGTLYALATLIKLGDYYGRK